MLGKQRHYSFKPLKHGISNIVQKPEVLCFIALMLVWGGISPVCTNLFLKFYKLMKQFVKNTDACLVFECNHVCWSFIMVVLVYNSILFGFVPLLKLAGFTQSQDITQFRASFVFEPIFSVSSSRSFFDCPRFLLPHTLRSKAILKTLSSSTVGLETVLQDLGLNL